jgi:hypothetical protein
VLTNPPYLARNKSENKEIYDKLGCNDLYKCFLATLIGSGCLGGIVIVPLNFVSSIRKADVELRAVLGGVRDTHDERVRGAVFDDTAYAVCSIQFSRKTEAETETETEPIRVHVSVPENDERGTDAREQLHHRRRNLQPAPQRRV